MKFILLFIVMNLTDPSDPAVLMHNQYDNKTECEEALKSIPQPPANLKAAGFCISSEKLLDLKHA